VVSSVEDLKLESKAKRCSQSKTKLRGMEVRQRNLRGIKAELGEDFLPGSRRRAAIQRHGWNCAIVIIARREVSVIEIFRIVDDISNLFTFLRCS
jgi:hypothetical protein